MKTKEAKKEVKKEVKNSVRTFANSKTGLSYTDMCRYYGADLCRKSFKQLISNQTGKRKFAHIHRIYI